MAHQSIRILVAAHGYEPAGWAAETGRVVSRWGGALVRLLSVLDVPCPPLTSPGPAARRLYGAARAAARNEARDRSRATVAALTAVLPRATEVVEVAAGRGPLGRTIAEHAGAWPADVVVVGPAAHRLRAWLWPGRVPAQVLARIPCAVLVTVPPPPARPARPLVVLPELAGLEHPA